ncbi:MAG: hypothetical protein JO110_11335 [Acetobacteraceae bacterium]|nr:hypothetical protein [Acetobacteraceae bacterium]
MERKFNAPPRDEFRKALFAKYRKPDDDDALLTWGLKGAAAKQTLSGSAFLQTIGNEQITLQSPEFEKAKKNGYGEFRTRNRPTLAPRF